MKTDKPPRAFRFRAWDSEEKRFVEPEEILEQRIPTIATEYGFELRSKFLFDAIHRPSGQERDGDIRGGLGKDDVGDIGIVRFGKLPLHKAGDCVCSYLAFYVECKGQIGRAPFHECIEVADWMEVIGNIHQHPDLLKKE